MTPSPQAPNLIIVLAQSKSWASIIRRHFTDAKLSWVLDLEGLEKEVFKNQAIAAIVEIPTHQVDETCVRLARMDNNSHNLKLFAVGEKELQDWQTLLRATGISAWFWSPLQASSLSAVIQRHRQTVKPRTVPLETGFESNLPWPNAADEGFE